MKHERPLLKLQLNKSLTIRPLCGGRVFELNGDLEAVRYIEGDEYRRQVKPPRLRAIEVEALKAWVSLYTPDEVKGRWRVTLTLSGVVFELNDSSYGKNSLSANAVDAMKALGFNNDNPFVFVPDAHSFYHRDLGIQIVANQEKDSYFLVDKSVNDEHRYMTTTYSLEQYQVYRPLAHAAVTLADRLLGIIGMHTAPDSGYDVVLRNGIGEISLLQNTDRLAMAEVVEDLIR